MISDEGLVPLATELIQHHDVLETLNLSNNRISSDGLTTLILSFLKADLQNLRKLNLSLNHGVPRKVAEHLKVKYPLLILYQ